MARIEDSTIFEKSALDEFNNPLPRKICHDRSIYLSRNQYGRLKDISKVLSQVRVTDFGFAVRNDDPHPKSIQVEAFRAPEVILGADWTYSADIWNLGVLLWDLLEPSPLFDPFLPGERDYDDRIHLGQISNLLGPAPKGLLGRGKRTPMFYDSDGNFLDHVEVRPISFESSIGQIGGEEKRRFIYFVRKMLKWEPAERKTAKELLDDAWLHKDFPEDDAV
jgi:serine/threonine-protein kinase SRPK3